MIDIKSKRNCYLLTILTSIGIVLFGLLIWNFDFEILFFIKNHMRNDFLNIIVPFYTSLGDDGIIWIIMGLVLLIPKKTRKCGIMVLATLLVMLIVNNIILKNLIARARPYSTYPELVSDLVDIIHIPTSYSFPSGHTVSAMAVAFTVFSQHKKFGVVTLILAFLMGLSRLYVGVHFPTDVYGGIIVAFLISISVVLAEKKLTPIITNKIAKTHSK